MQENYIFYTFSVLLGAIVKYMFLFGIFSIFLSGNSLAMDAAQERAKPFIVMLEGDKCYSYKLPFSKSNEFNIISLQKMQTFPFAPENGQLKNLAEFMQDKTNKKNKILYATNKEVLFALYYIVKNPTHFDALVLQNSSFNEHEFVSSETFFRDIPTLSKCERISNDIPIIFPSKELNDQTIHAFLSLAGKNVHYLPPAAVCDNVAEIYSLRNRESKPQQLDENVVRSLFDRKEKERIHRYKEYGWWVGSTALILFLFYKSGFLEKIVSSYCYKDKR